MKFAIPAIDKKFSKVEAELIKLRADNKALLDALKRIASDFECDYVLDGVVVDDPPRVWTEGYKIARAAISQAERP